MTARGRLTLVSSTETVDAYARAIQRLTDILIQHSLLATYEKFRTLELPYRFPRPDTIYPAALPGTVEDPNRNTAFLICVDGTLPRAIRKHFRLRASNRVTWANIRRLLPEADITDYQTAHNRVLSPEAAPLLRELLPLDYALVVERPADDDGRPLDAELTHLHVKVERLTDNALRDLGRRLGYIQRNLFERGEDYVDALEAKFFEYHGFAAHASGRKSAAAMACQLLQTQNLRFNVFVASQESGRLTVLDETDTLVQYILVEVEDAALDRLLRAMPDEASPADYLLYDSERPVVLLRADFTRTAAARPAEHRDRDADIQAPWLTVTRQTVLPLRGSAPSFEFTWSEA